MTGFVSQQSVVLQPGFICTQMRALRLGVCVAVLALFNAGGVGAQSPAVSGDSAQAMALIYGAEGVTQDVDAGLAILRSLAAAGDVAAQRDLGEMLIGGWAIPRDAAAGRPLLEAAADAGDVKAQLSLGTFLLYGTGLPKDMAGARVQFERAAERGDPTGLRRYGEALMWSQQDPKAAQAYLTRAGEMGQGAAWAILAEGAMYGYLGGGKTSRMKFDGFARRARAMGNERIEVLDATRQMWGISMRADGPATLARLAAAADAGNAEAARYLIALVRDGNGMNIRKEPARAAALTERYAGLLSPAEQWRYGVTIAAAKTRQLRSYPGLQQRLMEAPEQMSVDFGKDLFKANPNFAIYLLQARMQQTGAYHGKLDGLAGARTVRSLSRVCRATLSPGACAHGVLSGDVVGALIAK
jgi:TPR repeat protein